MEGVDFCQCIPALHRRLNDDGDAVFSLLDFSDRYARQVGLQGQGDLTVRYPGQPGGLLIDNDAIFFDGSAPIVVDVEDPRHFSHFFLDFLRNREHGLQIFAGNMDLDGKTDGRASLEAADAVLAVRHVFGAKGIQL